MTADLRVPLDQLELGLGAPKTDWLERAIAFVERFVRDHGYVTPDDLQAWAMESHDEPETSQLYGVAWSKLRTMGLERTTVELTSAIRSNNGRKVRKYVAGSAWKQRGAA